MNPTTTTVKKTMFANFVAITKARLAISVVFSTIAGYLLGVETVNVTILFLLALGGYFMVGASNAFNQLIEKDKTIHKEDLIIGFTGSFYFLITIIFWIELIYRKVKINKEGEV